MNFERSAELRDGIIIRRTIIEAGYSEEFIRWRLDSGRWERVRPGVYRVVGSQPTWLQQVRSAQATAGESSWVSHSTCARMLDFESGRESGLEEIEISAPLARQVRIPGVVGHRTGIVEDRDITVRHGIPCSSALRLVIDLSSRLDDDALGRLLDEALRRRLLRLNDLRERMPRLRPAPGRSVRRIERVLAARSPGFAPGESVLEARLSAVIVGNGFPPPIAQHWVRGAGWRARLDFAYPDQGLYLEGDGFGFHFTASDLDNDARRRNRLHIAGWRGLVFTWRMTDVEIIESLDALYDRSTHQWRVCSIAGAATPGIEQTGAVA